MSKRTIPTVLGSALAVALGLIVSSCATGTPGATPTATSPATTAATPSAGSTATTAKATETDHAEPRLVVTLPTEALVLDAASHQVLATIPTDGTANRLTVGSDDRFVFLTSTETGVTRILDAGSYAQAHGDHAHFYVKDPVLLEQELKGSDPIHQVSHDGRTAVFSDATGDAQVIFDELLVPGPAKVTEIKTGGPQHGVVVPLGKGYLATVPPPAGGSPLPAAVARLDENGKEIGKAGDCPELHGEVAHEDTAVFGCGDSVLVVGPKTAKNLPLPEGADGRVGQLLAAPDSDIVVGDLGDSSLALVDLDDERVTEIKVGAGVAALTRTGDGDVAIITDRGELIAYDVDDAKEIGRHAVIDPFEIPKSHSGVRPQLTAVGEQVFITDPAKAELVFLDLDSKSQPERTKLPAKPHRIGAVNTLWLEDDHDGHDDHDHDDH